MTLSGRMLAIFSNRGFARRPSIFVVGLRAPVTSNQTLEGRAQNRRVVLVIVGT